jgi:hypothetical protein
MSAAQPIGPGWRADVRNVVARILKERIPDVGERIYRARVWPVGGNAKPALLVYGYAEKKQLVNQGGWQHQFDVAANMVVRVLVEGTVPEQVEARCEALAGQVERVILRAPELFAPQGGILRRCAAVDTQIEAAQKEGAVEVEATMQFQLVWDEIFTMPEPDTSECEGADYRPQYPALNPTP